MDTRFIETFLAVVDHGSMAEAARRLGLTPAAVAQRMQALETELGAKLLRRVGKQVRPTEAGHAILEPARKMVADARLMRSRANAGLTAGELRLGAISTALTGLLPQALLRLRHRFPAVELFVLPGASADLHAALDAGRIDAALLVRPPFEIPKTRDWHVVRREPLILLVPVDLADRDPLELIATQPFIRYDRANWGGRLAQAWLEANNLRPREWLELDQLEAISVMVSNGLGISVLPDWAPPWPEGVAARRIPLPAPAMEREIGVLWNRDSPGVRLIDAVIGALSETASSIG
ncbi:LysR family transcriptional regulator [Paracoccus sp. KR1-242]|uniref:LysR family transcriptional regulator n=1 Tax=Paracoccus sp. KR1-242 TaxID=3410028 RepID=UPI003C049E3A